VAEKTRNAHGKKTVAEKGTKGKRRNEEGRSLRPASITPGPGVHLNGVKFRKNLASSILVNHKKESRDIPATERGVWRHPLRQNAKGNSKKRELGVQKQDPGGPRTVICLDHDVKKQPFRTHLPSSKLGERSK